MPENDDQQTGGSGLRAQLEAALEENKQLKERLSTGENAVRELAFRDAGIDTKSGVGKLLAKTYDGDLEPEAIGAFAKEHGIDVEETANASSTEQPDPTQQRMDDLRNASGPTGSGERLSKDDWLALTKSDPQAALQARREGRVDLPPSIEQNLAANQAVRLGG